VETQRVDQAVGFGEGGDVFRGEEGREAFLPEIVSALDLAPFGFAQGRLLACGVGAWRRETS
jgi:hypothetical protein